MAKPARVEGELAHEPTADEPMRTPKAERLAAWTRLDDELDRKRLAAMTTTIGFDAIPNAAHDIVAGKVRGRLVVEIG